MAAKRDYSAADEARRLVAQMIRIESRGAGDTENAMRRLAQRHGMNWRTFWTLRYRAPKDVMTGVLRQLRDAHAAETKRQIARLQHELHIAKINGVHVEDLQDQASNLAAELAACMEKRED